MPRSVRKLAMAISVIFVLIIVLLSVWIAIGDVLADPSIDELLAKTEFQVPMSDVVETVKPYNKDGLFYVFLPSGSHGLNLKVTFPYANLTLGGTTYASGDELQGLQEQIEYPVVCRAKGKTVSARMVFYRSQNIGTVCINTATGSLAAIEADKTHKESGEIAVYTQNGVLDYADDLAYIKGHGQYSWKHSDKKSYNLVLNQAKSVLNMGKTDKWVLLANSLDLSAIRNKVIYDFSKEVGMELSCESDFVDLYVNGEYRGLYQFCQSEEKALENIPNGSFFKMEIFERVKGNANKYVTPLGQNIISVQPPKCTTVFKNRLDEFEKLIESDFDLTELAAYIDIDSWVKNYLIEEVFLDYDAAGMSQFFYTYGNVASSPIFAGPVWDFDNSSGNDSPKVSHKNSFLANLYSKNMYMKTPWFSRLYRNPNFYSVVCNQYKLYFSAQLRNYIKTTVKDLEQRLKIAKYENDIRWSVDSSNQVERFESFMYDRLDFLDRVWINQEGINCVTFVTNRTFPENISMGYFDSETCYLSDHDLCEDSGIQLEWYTDKELTQKCPASFVPDGDVTLYAKTVSESVDSESQTAGTDITNAVSWVVCLTFAVLLAFVGLFYLRHIKRGDNSG